VPSCAVLGLLQGVTCSFSGRNGVLSERCLGSVPSPGALDRAGSDGRNAVLLVLFAAGCLAVLGAMGGACNGHGVHWSWKCMQCLDDCTAIAEGMAAVSLRGEII